MRGGALGRVLHDSRGVIRGIDPTLASFLGYGEAHLYGCGLFVLLPNCPPEDFPGRVHLVHELGRVPNTVPLRHRDGHMIPRHPDSYREPRLSSAGEPMVLSFEFFLDSAPDLGHGPVDMPEDPFVLAKVGDAGLDGVSLARAIDAYQRHPQFAGTTLKHQGEVLRVLDAVIATTGWTLMSDVDALGLESYMTDLCQRFGNPVSANHALKYWRSFVRWAVRRRMLEDDPLDVVKPVTDHRGRTRRALTAHEVERLIVAGNSAGRSTWRGTLYQFAAATGLRAGEIAAMHWTWLHEDDAGRSWVTVPRQNARKARRVDEVPLNSDATHALDQMRRFRSDDRPFPNVPNSRTFDRDLVRAQIPKKTDAGIACFHSLRHTLATRLAQAGVAPQIAQLLMRHADVTTTMTVYTDRHLLDLASAAKSVEGLDTARTVVQDADAVVSPILQQDDAAVPAAGHDGTDHSNAAGVAVPSGESPQSNDLLTPSQTRCQTALHPEEPEYRADARGDQLARAFARSLDPDVALAVWLRLRGAPDAEAAAEDQGPPRV